MIFLSYNHKDQNVVKPIANRLASVFSSENIFFDDWSIQPGDGIIDSMSKGLETAKYFFFFVSKSSLQSKMVDLEWQNALLKASRGELKLIPVKLDDCLMPAILLQTLYIDLFGKGMEVAFRQMVDVVHNEKKQPDTSQQTYENVRAFISKDADKINIEIRAMTYMEPQSRFGILVCNEEADFGKWEKGSPMFQSRFQERVAQLNNGEWANAVYFERQRPLSPGFPYVLELTENQDKKLKLIEVMHASDENFYRFIPRQLA